MILTPGFLFLITLAATSSAKQPITPEEARTAQKVELDVAQLYKQIGALDTTSPAAACSSVSAIELRAGQALGDLRDVPKSPTMQPMIQTFRSGLVDIQAGARATLMACRTGEPVQGEPLARIARGMKKINRFNQDSKNFHLTLAPVGDTTPPSGGKDDSTGVGAGLVLVLVLVSLFLYFLPSIGGRHKHNASAILVLNIFLGWTLIGWVFTFVWAVTKDNPPSAVR